VYYGNMFSFDVSGADVFVLCLLQGTNQQIKDKLKQELRPGVRVVSHTFFMPGWAPVAPDDRRWILVHEIRMTDPEVRTRFM